MNHCNVIDSVNWSGWLAFSTSFGHWLFNYDEDGNQRFHERSKIKMFETNLSTKNIEKGKALKLYDSARMTLNVLRREFIAQHWSGLITLHVDYKRWKGLNNLNVKRARF